METVNTVPKLLRNAVLKWPNIAAQYEKDENKIFQPTTYSELLQNVYDVSAGLLSIGVKRGDLVGLIADNRKEWLESSFGIMAIGAGDVPRGCDATLQDLSYILSSTECNIVIVENETQIKKILEIKKIFDGKTLVEGSKEKYSVKQLISFDIISEETIKAAKSQKIKISQFSDLKKNGADYRVSNPNMVESELEAGAKDEIACIIFTSGTTGEPKGVMLTHENFLSQFTDLQERIYLNPGDKALCVLPVWHSFERSCEYVILLQGGSICYSKPVGSIMLPDLQTMNPQLMPAVPRIFEAVFEGVDRSMRKTGGVVLALYKFFVAAGNAHSKMDRKLFNKEARFKKNNAFLDWLIMGLPWLLLCPLKALGNVIIFKKVRAKLGTGFRGAVSGGGALPPAVDNFFWTVGINLVEGYGLTETSPVVSVRPLKNPIFGTIGKPLNGVEVKIVGEDGKELPPGEKGLVYIRGGIVMKGYYKRPDLTEAVIDKDGWFNSGDLGLKTIDGEVSIRGRIKDTIVLRGGENIEPVPIEQKMKLSPYISQVVVMGQDERHLGALIIPEEAELKSYATANNIDFSKYEDLMDNKEIHTLFENEILGLINSKNGFRLFERIYRFALLAKPFEVGKELSAKQDVMRHKVGDFYEKEMKYLFK